MNKKISVIIVDDDVLSIKRLSDDLATFSDISVITTSTSPTKAQKIIIEMQPDLIFLDIEMPEMSGIELLKRMQPDLHPEVKVVFYTAFNKYVLEALRASAFDYLLKPYMPDELSTIIERYRSYTPQNTETLEQSLNKLLIQNNVFAIQTFKGLLLLSVEKVLLFQYTKEHNCWQILRSDDSKFYKLRSSISSKDLMAISKSFVQISQDCIINLNYLATVENKSLICVFYPPFDNIKRTASQRYFKKLRERLEII